MAGNGGARPNAGRKKGVPNKATIELKDYAKQYTKEAVDALVGIVRVSESDAARVAAANAILDRGYGKPSQALTGEDGGAIQVATRIELVGIRADDD